MHFRFGLVDGEIVESGALDFDEIQPEIDKVDGLVGTGDFHRVCVEDPEDLIAFLCSIYDRIIADPATGDLTVEDKFGNSRKFLGEQLAWYRLVR